MHSTGENSPLFSRVYCILHADMSKAHQIFSSARYAFRYCHYRDLCKTCAMSRLKLTRKWKLARWVHGGNCLITSLPILTGCSLGEPGIGSVLLLLLDSCLLSTGFTKDCWTGTDIHSTKCVQDQQAETLPFSRPVPDFSDFALC